MIRSIAASPWARRGVLVAALRLSLTAQGGTLSAAARGEIDAILMRLEASGCQFNRNGAWYPPATAKGHLLRKLEYLEDKGLVDSAEQFIERGASRSSMTGRPYLVKCRDEQPVESQAWLTEQLESVRHAGAAAKPAH
jgi:hypothetical protein